jgi:two-component system phosphate regulon sensor histidine kinase PhoR
MSGALRTAVAMLVRGLRVTLTIRVTRAARGLSRRGPAVGIIVTDEGEGVDPIPAVPDRAVLPRRKPPLARAGAAGLRLAIVTFIETWHRGRFRTTSDAGRGSTFSVIRPAA